MTRLIFAIEPPAQSDGGAARWFHVVRDRIWESDGPAESEWPRHFLGLLDGRPCWAVDVSADADPADGAAVDLRTYYGGGDDSEWLMAGRAVQIVEWARTHRFCGRCGVATEQAAAERAMRCPSCRLLVFPRLAPAIITLITRHGGSEVLLANGVQFRGPWYSCLAGFVEPGENLEDAVHREVGEEVGVRLGAVSYWGSQPWPFPHSLMVGFRAEWEDGDIVIDPTEIADAQWFTRDAMPPIPPGISIARRLIDAWVAEG